jgi:hypothetical protein
LRRWVMGRTRRSKRASRAKSWPESANCSASVNFSRKLDFIKLVLNHSSKFAAEESLDRLAHPFEVLLGRCRRVEEVKEDRVHFTQAENERPKI